MEVPWFNIYTDVLKLWSVKHFPKMLLYLRKK